MSATTTDSSNGVWCNQSEEPSYLEQVVSVEGHPAYISITVILCAVGMVVNVLVLCVYRKSHLLHEHYGYEYIVNLAAADLTVGAGFLTVTAASSSIIRHHPACWEGGLGVCYVAILAFLFPQQASLAALSVVAIVTMIRVYLPLRTPLILTTLRCRVLLAAPWLLAAIVTMVGMATTDCSQGMLHMQPSRVSQYLQQVVLMAVTALMITINVALLLKTSRFRRASTQRHELQEEMGESCRYTNESGERAKDSSDGSKGSKCTTSSRRDAIMKGQCHRGSDRGAVRRVSASASFWLHKSVYITIFVIATFLVCNLPFLVATAVLSVDDIRQLASTGKPRPVDELTSLVSVVSISRLLSLINTAANFFIYTLRNELFRTELVKFLKSLHALAPSR